MTDLCSKLSLSPTKTSLDRLVELCKKILTMHPRNKTPRECPTCNGSMRCRQFTLSTPTKRRRDITESEASQVCAKRLKNAKTEFNQLKKEIKVANKELDTLRMKNEFLTSFDLDATDASFRSDVSFVKSSDDGDPTDHVLHAHRFVLLRDELIAKLRIFV